MKGKVEIMKGTKSNAWEIFTRVFTICIITLTLGMVTFWVYKFGLNQDLTTVDFKHFYDSQEDVFPSLSMCFHNPFLASEGKENQEINQSKVQNYLSGEEKFEVLDVDYQNITFELTDYLNMYWISWANGSSRSYLPSQYAWNVPRVSFSGFWRDRFYKCFSIEIPDKSSRSVGIMLSQNVFPQGIRPKMFGMLVFFHYPNQVLRPDAAVKHHWQNRESNKSHTMKFLVDNVEIFRRRKDCYENWTHYDDHVREYHMQNVGCRAPYHVSKTDLPLCNTTKDMKEIRMRLSLGINYDIASPCRAMEKLTYQYDEINISGSEWDHTGQFWCLFMMQDSRFKVNM